MEPTGAALHNTCSQFGVCVVSVSDRLCARVVYIAYCIFSARVICSLGVLMADLCQGCNKKVAKTAKALACDLCRKWYHGPCGGIEDADYDFMKHRRGHGLCWFCGECVPDADIAHSTR